MADKKKEYLIGDVSRIVGLSRDALRFYEKKGVIRANKKENGYRYFSDEDIYRLMCIVYRRKMNDSLEEIRESVKDNRSVAGMRRHLEQRIKEEEEEILRRRQSIARMSLSLKDMDCIEDCMGKYSLKKFPQAYILDTCEDIYDGLRQWFSMSSEVSGLFTICSLWNMSLWKTEGRSFWCTGDWSILSVKALICPDIRLRIRYPVSIL